ncbi:unnamed protein product [Staurois parvus]|uniref:Uncharacterized protein n=1 Tax=Staurois parvus TaxID=386267 RepID=A0ABN9ADG8_9NEOB|nr:unnamed protein product [Staurois parvus]
MLVILTVEPKGVNPLHCVKRMFDSVFSDSSLLPQSPVHLLIEQSLGGKLNMLSLESIAREFFSFLGECM